MNNLFWCLILLLFSSIHGYSQPRIISTFAGNGIRGYSGNGGPALNASINGPEALCSDKQGNIYLADYENRVIRKINTSGVITVFAGTGELGYTGDGGPAVQAQMGYPYGICMDEQDNLYFSDSYWSVIRKITPAGIISTYGGKLGSIPYSGDGGPAIEAGMMGITSICMDKQGNLFIAEFGNHVIRKISKSGIISTVAGIGNFSGYSGDGGPATEASLHSPTGVAVDQTGNIYISDMSNNVIRRVGTDGIIRRFAGTGQFGNTGEGGLALNATFYYPYFVFVDDTSGVYISDVANHVLRYVNTEGLITTIAGNGTAGFSGDGGSPISAQMNIVGGITMDPTGNIYISDRINYRIRKISVCDAPVISKQPQSQRVCAGQGASFFIEETIGKLYNWEINTGTGWKEIVDNATYSGANTKTLNIVSGTLGMNGSQFRCRVINDCGALPSESAVLNVSTDDPLSVEIATQDINICQGTKTSFTATIKNSGTNLVYSWRKNNTVVGTNSEAYSDSSLQEGDRITCSVFALHPCLGAQQALSNEIAMTVIPKKPLSVSILASGNNICADSNICFTANAINGGSQPSWEWRINGVVTGDNAPQLNSATLMNGDKIECILTSSENCLVENGVKSNEITMVVRPKLLPAISIVANDSTICDGTLVTFKASAVNGGSSAAYEWRKNGNVQGINIDSYSEASLRNGDMITCMVISNESCLQFPSANSAPVAMVVYNNPDVSLDNNPEICTGGSRVLDAGQFDKYLWNNSSTQRSLTVKMPGVYHVNVIDTNGCKGGDTVNINIALKSPSSFLIKDTAICSYNQLVVRPNQSFKSYLWSNNSTSSSLLIKNSGVYWLEVKDNKNCVGRDTLNVIQKECITGIFVPNAFTPNNDGLNDTFKPLVYGQVLKYSFTIYNRWGETVFQTKDPQKGWDGTVNRIKQSGNVFVWLCNYQLEGGVEKVEKGSVMVTR